MTVAVSDVALTVIMQDGGSSPVQPPPVFEWIAAELRSMMYEPGKGTWFGMRFMMEPPSQFWVSYNNAYEPQWEPPIPAGAYVQDLAAFPRDENSIPGWLKARLAEAEAETETGGMAGEH